MIMKKLVKTYLIDAIGIKPPAKIKLHILVLKKNVKFKLITLVLVFMIGINKITPFVY